MYLEPGDVVLLKSGGPRMCVEEIADNDITAVYFDRDDRLQRSSFSPIVLYRVEAVEVAE